MKQWTGFLLLAGLALLPFGIGDFGGVNGGRDSYAGMGLWVVGVTAFFVLFQWIARRAGLGGFADMGLQRRPGWTRHLALGFGYGIFCILFALGMKIGLGQYELHALPWQQTLYAALMLLVSTLYIALSEELVFRGYLLKLLGGHSQTAAALMTAVLFVAFHVPHWGQPAQYWFGLLFRGLFYVIPVLATRSLWFSVGHHWAWNFVIFLLFSGESGVQAIQVAGYPVLADYVYLIFSVLMAASAPFAGRLLVKADSSRLSEAA